MKRLIGLTFVLMAASVCSISSIAAAEACPPSSGQADHVVQHTETAQSQADVPGTKSLYDRLGGEAAITAVVDDFVARAAANPKVNFFRKGTKEEWKPTPEDIAKLKKHLVQLVSMVTGGPQKYEGRPMKEVHAGMEISDMEFAAIAADLVATLDKFKVPAAEQKELLKIVGGTSKDIVEKHTKPQKASVQ